MAVRVEPVGRVEPVPAVVVWVHRVAAAWAVCLAAARVREAWAALAVQAGVPVIWVVCLAPRVLWGAALAAVICQVRVLQDRPAPAEPAIKVKKAITLQAAQACQAAQDLEPQVLRAAVPVAARAVVHPVIDRAVRAVKDSGRVIQIPV